MGRLDIDGREHLRPVQQSRHLCETLTAERWEPQLGRALAASQRAPTLSAFTSSGAWATLVSTLRLLDASAAPLREHLLTLVAGHRWDPEADPAAALRGVVSSWYVEWRRDHPGTHTDLIAGIVTPAPDHADPAINEALTATAELIRSRAARLAADATSSGQPWVTALGPQPTEPDGRRRWRDAAVAVAAYRDRWNITRDEPLGTDIGEDRTQQRDHTRASRALSNIAADNSIGIAARDRTLLPAAAGAARIDTSPDL